VPFGENDGDEYSSVNPSTKRLLNYYVRESAADHDGNVVKHGGGGNEGKQLNWFQRTFKEKPKKEKAKDNLDIGGSEDRSSWIL